MANVGGGQGWYLANIGGLVAKVGGLVAKVGRWLAKKVGRWVAKVGRGWWPRLAKVGGWPRLVGGCDETSSMRRSGCCVARPRLAGMPTQSSSCNGLRQSFAAKVCKVCGSLQRFAAHAMVCAAKRFVCCRGLQKSQGLLQRFEEVATRLAVS